MAVTLVTVVALMGIGSMALLSAKSEVESSGQGRFQQAALYAAESGVAAGLEFLRNNCSATELFSQWVQPANADPLSPSGIVGNGAKPGQTGNPFPEAALVWYEVTLLNNIGDPGFAAGEDQDGIIVLRVVGHGPNNTRATLEVEVQNDTCIATFCEREYAQRNVTARNDAFAACAQQVSAGAGTRTLVPEEP